MVTGHSLGAGIAVILTLLLVPQYGHNPPQSSRKPLTAETQPGSPFEGQEGEFASPREGTARASNHWTPLGYESKSPVEAEKEEKVLEAAPTASSPGPEEDAKDASTAAQKRPTRRLVCWAFACPGCVISPSLIPW